MLNKFKKYIQNIVPISDAEFEKTASNFEQITLQKGECFVEQNKVCKQIAFLNFGMLRSYYINDGGDDITSCFCTQNNLATSYKSFSTQTPSNITMVALEKTELIVISFENLTKLYAESTHWQTVGRLVAEKEYLALEQYASVLNNESAKQKYLRLLNEQPEIVQKAPVNFIASYLGVTRRTLSRIRKEISE